MTDLAQATQVGFDAFGPQRNESLSQFYTPPTLAQQMFRWAGSLPLEARILEPSCGLGALVKPFLAAEQSCTIDAVDIDARNIDWCRENLTALNVRWERADYLTRPAPSKRYDLSISNVPYNKDDKGIALDGRFLSKLMDESDRIITLIRATSLCGAYRYKRVWSRCEGPESEWIVRSAAYLPERPNCGGEGGKIDFCVVKASRRTERDHGVTSCVEFWR